MVVTPMMADILAIQNLYGRAQGGPTAGDTLYGVGSKLGSYLDGVFGGGAGHLTRNAMTIFDEGGVDTIDFRNDATAQVVTLAPGGFSDVYGLTGNLGIARGTLIERYVAGSASDGVRGNGASNLLILNGGSDCGRGFAGEDAIRGGAGADRLFGGTGADQLKGGLGADDLDGGAGADALWGGGGADRFVFRGGQDRIVDFADDKDRLLLDDALWGGTGKTLKEVLDLARVSQGDVVFTFAGGHSLRVEGMDSLRDLRDDLAVV
jgi:serralysin